MTFFGVQQRLEQYGQVGGEIYGWLAAECPTQCQTVGAEGIPDGLTCALRCEEATLLSLDVSRCCHPTSAAAGLDVCPFAAAAALLSVQQLLPPFPLKASSPAPMCPSHVTILAGRL